MRPEPATETCKFIHHATLQNFLNIHEDLEVEDEEEEMQFMFIDENLQVEDQAIEPQDDMDNQQNQRNPSVSQPLAVRVGDTSQRSPEENNTTVTDSTSAAGANVEAAATREQRPQARSETKRGRRRCKRYRPYNTAVTVRSV